MALESLGVMRMVFAPALIMFSMAVTWPALSPSVLPAPVSSLPPLAVAACWAPSFIFTKKGLVSVLVIRPMTGGCWAATVAARAVPAKANRTVRMVCLLEADEGIGCVDSGRRALINQVD